MAKTKQPIQRSNEQPFPGSDAKIGNLQNPPSGNVSVQRDESDINPQDIFSIKKIKNLEDLDKFMEEAEDYYGEDGIVYISEVIMGDVESRLRFYVVKTLMPNDFDEINEVTEERFKDYLDFLKERSGGKINHTNDELEDQKATVLMEETIKRGTLYPFDFAERVEKRRYMPGDASQIMSKIYVISGWTQRLDRAALEEEFAKRAIENDEEEEERQQKNIENEAIKTMGGMYTTPEEQEQENEPELTQINSRSSDSEANDIDKEFSN